MIGELADYAEYAESEMPWARRVPAHWGKRRTKFLFRERVEKGFPDAPLLAATQNMGVVRKTDYGQRTVTAMKDLHLLKLVEPGDFVVSLRSFQGGLEIAHYRGIISPAYTILQPRPDAMRGYFRHFFKSPDFIRNLTLFVTGIREGQNIDYERLSRAYLPLPPVEEQELIARFLDHADGRLERAIRAKRKVIALLNEQKQAIIHRALTRGLDPTVRVKPSGVAWIGDIPVHWEVLRGKYVGKLFSTPSVLDNELSEDCEGNMMYLKVSDLVGADSALRLSRSRLYVRRKVGRNDRQKAFLVFPKRGGAIYTNRVVIVKSNCFLDPNLMGWQISDRFDPRYVALLLKTRTLSDLADVSSVPQINNHHINPIPFPAPPVKEQRAILIELDRVLVGVNTAITRLEREVALLREYQTRLVADVVTGKLDVRPAAAHLPAGHLPSEPEVPLSAAAEGELAAAETDD